MSASPLIEFANTLHQHGVGSGAAEAFKRDRKSDKEFLRRAAVLERMFENRGRLLKVLAEQDQQQRQHAAHAG